MVARSFIDEPSDGEASVTARAQGHAEPHEKKRHHTTSPLGPLYSGASTSRRLVVQEAAVTRGRDAESEACERGRGLGRDTREGA